MDVIDRMHQALQRGTGVHLSHADLGLLWAVLGDELAKAEQEIETWQERFAEYERDATRGDEE